MGTDVALPAKLRQSADERQMINKGQHSWKKRPSASARDPEPPDEIIWEEEESPEAPEAGNPRLQTARDCVKELTNQFRLFCKCNEPSKQIELLGMMQQGVKALRQSFSIAELSLWAKFTAAVSTFVFATSEKPGFPTFSAFRTMADALDLLRLVVVSGERWNGSSTAAITALVVDENAGSRKNLLQALQTQGIIATESPSAEHLFRTVQSQAFDVIFFDTSLAGLDEFTLTTELRKLPEHRVTPIILLTPHPDFEARSSSLLSASCDFIARPIAPSEAAVKAFVFGLKHRLERVSATPAVAPAGAARRAAEAPPISVTPERESPAAEQRWRAAEQQVIQLTEARNALEQELSARTQQLQEAQEKADELRQAQQSLRLELGRASRRETQLKQQISALEQQLELLNQTLGETRQDLAQESERRLAAEAQATQLAQTRARLEQQMAVEIPAQPQTKAQVREVEKSQQSLRNELNATLRREEQLKKRYETLEQQLDTLNQNLGRSRQDLSKENERRLTVEQQATELSQARSRFEQELAGRTLQLQQAQEQVQELEKNQQSLRAELTKISRRETQFKQQTAALEQLVEALSQSAEQARQELAQENEHRLEAEQKTTQLNRRIQELTRAESAVRQQMEQASRDHAQELVRVQAALQKEAEARKDAEKAQADQAASLAKLASQLAEGRLQAQQTRERAAALEQARKLVQAELRGALERQSQIDQQAVSLDQQLGALNQTLKPGS